MASKKSKQKVVQVVGDHNDNDGSSTNDDNTTILPASSDSTSTTAAGSSFTVSSYTPSDPSTSSASLTAAAAAAAAVASSSLSTITKGEAATATTAIDNDATSTTPSTTISSLKEQGHQLLLNTLKDIEPASTQLMNSLKEQGQAAYMNLTSSVLAPNLTNPFANTNEEEEEEEATTSSTTAILSPYPLPENSNDDEEGSLSNNHGIEEQDLKQTYPLQLQRSASSAFGSPSSSNRSRNKSGTSNNNRVRSTTSNSGGSDPGGSAFNPVWGYKSAGSSAGSISGSNFDGSEVGSAVTSSSIAVSTIRSANSDPFPGSFPTSSSGDNINGSPTKKRSPWKLKLFKSRIKKQTSSPSSSTSNRERWASFSNSNSKREQLGGRENPHLTNLNGGDEEEEEGEEEVEGSIYDNNLGEMKVPSMVGLEEGSGNNTTAHSSQVATASSGSSSKKKSKNKKKSLSKSSGGSKKGTATSPKKKQQSEGGTISSLLSRSKKDEKQYDDPGVELDLSDSDNELDGDDTFAPIGENHHSLGDDDDRPPSIIPPSQVGSSRSEKIIKGEEQQERPESIEVVPCDSVEVISTLVTPTPFDHHQTQSSSSSSQIKTTIKVISPHSPDDSIEKNSPPTVERVAVIVEEAPYHPLRGDTTDAVESALAAANLSRSVAAKLKYRSPQRSSSRLFGNHNNRHSPSSTGHGSPSDGSRLSGGSPSSRISSSNSRTSAQTSSTLNSGGDRTINTLHSADGSLVVDSTDYEIREANRRSGIRGRIVGGETHTNNNNQEVVSGHDGNETVLSSSTTSSNYHMASPTKTLRDGATMPAREFFAGGNVAMSPSPQRGMNYPMSGGASVGDNNRSPSPGISKFLSPKKLTRIGASGMSNSTSSSASKGTHSPHTVSSASVSANSSSSENLKKPLQFVTYEKESPFDEPPDSYAAAGGGVGETPASPTSGASLIKPRISKVVNSAMRHRPPMIPPHSPRKPEASTTMLYGRARTPTRTPPPSSHRETAASGANTPCSPPVIIDHCDLNTTKTTKPFVVRRSSSDGGSGRGIFLVSSTGQSPRRTSPWPHRRGASMAVVGEEEGDNNDNTMDGHEITILSTDARTKVNDIEHKGDSIVTVVTPEKGF